MPMIRLCRDEERPAILRIINAAAEKYRGVIPDDCWHEPYMSAQELGRQIAEGVIFWGAEVDGALAGVMGAQKSLDVDLIRHAYVTPERQRGGLGGALLGRLSAMTEGKVLVGTWAAAGWAIGFYERHGFTRVPVGETAPLLRKHWSISDRQIETSVVLRRG